MGAVEQPARARADLHAPVAAAATRLAGVCLAAVPLALGIGHFVALHIADAPDIWFQYRGALVYPVDIAVALTCVLWIIGRGARATGRIGVAATCLLVLAVAAAISLMWAIDRIVAVAVAAHLASLALFAVAAADLARRSEAFWNGLAIAVLAQSVAAAWQVVTQSTAPFGTLFNGWSAEFAARDSVAVVAALPGVDRWLRAYGTFPHPNILAFFLVVALLLLAIRGRRSWLADAALLAGTATLALTFSRTAWLAVSVGIVVWTLTTRPWRDIPASVRDHMRARPLLAALVVIGLLLAGVRVARLDAPPESNTLEQRAAYDEAAWALVRDGPPVGAGNLLIAEQRRAMGVGEPAHNVFLITIAELSVPGAAAWLVVLALLIGSAARGREPHARGAILATAGLLVPLLALDHYLWTGTPGRTLFALALALIPIAARVRA